jgi:hypothetical protein
MGSIILVFWQVYSIKRGEIFFILVSCLKDCTLSRHEVESCCSRFGLLRRWHRAADCCFVYGVIGSHNTGVKRTATPPLMPQGIGRMLGTMKQLGMILLIPIGFFHSVRLSGRAAKEVHCEVCNSVFYYVLFRAVTAIAFVARAPQSIGLPSAANEGFASSC